MRSLIFVFIVASVSVFGRQADPELVEAQKMYDLAVEKKDSVTLRKMFHPDMVVTGGNGSRRNATAEIKDCVDPRYKVAYFKTNNIETRVFDKTAILLGDLEWQITSGDQPMTLKRRITYTYVKLKGEWVIVAMHIGQQPKS